MKKSGQSSGRESEMDTQNRHSHDAGGVVHPDILIQLRDLLTGSAEVKEFLGEMSRAAAERLSARDNEVSCGVTVIRRKRPVTVASSDPRARRLDELQNSYGDGPCLTALREGTKILVPDVHSDNRWPAYLRATAANGVVSILAVPMDVKSTGQAVLNLYSPRVLGFSEESIAAAEDVAGEASRALHLALKIAQLSELRDDLTAALESRTMIATAVGVIMAENRCTRDKAFQVLVDASSHRNVKLRVLAENIVDKVGGDGGHGSIFQE